MRTMKTGEPCPCCGQAIPAILPVDKRLLASIVAEGLAIQNAVRTVEHGGAESQETMPTLTPPNEWVNVEERLPKPWEEVLIFSAPYVDIGYLLQTGDFYSKGGFDNISHWMPLPASPERRSPEGKT